MLASASTLNSDSVLSHLQTLNSHCLQRTFGLQRNEFTQVEKKMKHMRLPHLLEEFGKTVVVCPKDKMNSGDVIDVPIAQGVFGSC